jgi:hypothetical protein
MAGGARTMNTIPGHRTPKIHKVQGPRVRVLVTYAE